MHASPLTSPSLHNTRDGERTQTGGRPSATPAPQTRYDARIAELEGAASGGGSKTAAAAGEGAGASGGLRQKGAGVAGGLLLTAAEYTAHVAALHGELEEAWAKEEKVTALKVTVQVCCIADASAYLFSSTLVRYGA